MHMKLAANQHLLLSHITWCCTAGRRLHLYSFTQPHTTVPSPCPFIMVNQLCLRSRPVGRRGALVATMLWLTWVCSLLDVSDGAAARDLPCPNANDISPCACTVKADFTMDMDCSQVSSSNELSEIFGKDFPFLDFDTLLINDNPHIRSIRIGDLGQATFQRINITGGTLESVVHGALENSYGTLVSLDLSGNHVTDFPFDEVSSFTDIDELDFSYNALDTFPHIHSSTLRSLQMGYNPLNTIGASFFNDLPNLKNIGLQGAQLSSLQPGTVSLNCQYCCYCICSCYRCFRFHGHCHRHDCLQQVHRHRNDHCRYTEQLLMTISVFNNK